MNDVPITDEMDMKPAAVPALDAENPYSMPQPAPMEDKKPPAVAEHTHPIIGEHQLKEPPAYSMGEQQMNVAVNTNTNFGDHQMMVLPQEDREEVPAESFSDEEQAGQEPVPNAAAPAPLFDLKPAPASDQTAAPAPLFSLNDPPPPAVNAPALDAPEAEPADVAQPESVNEHASPSPEIDPAAPPINDEEAEPGSVASTGGDPVLKKDVTAAPSVEPKGAQEDSAQREATDGDDDAEEGSAKPKPKKAGSKREVNPKFKDVQETGSWGGISTVEKVVVGVLAIAILVGVIVAVVIVLGRDDTPKEELVPAITLPPTAKATAMPADEKFGIILAELENNPVTAPTAGTLSTDISTYAGKADDEAACVEFPTECAMDWYLYKDDFPPESNNIMDRFALATLYYSLGGPGWKNNTKWLTDASYCQWYGLSCNRRETEVEEIDLAENKLVGKLPIELSLIDTVAVMSLKQNQISGGLPGDVIASMPKLFVLYLQNNMLTGPIPDNLINEEESLALLFIHGNDFNGTWPEVYCQDPGFREFSLDCTSKNPCPDDCCKSENCF